MTDHPCNKGRSPARPSRPGRVTREMVQARTRELALMAGRPPPHVLQADYEQAKRELTGVADPERQEAILARARIFHGGDDGQFPG